MSLKTKEIIACILVIILIPTVWYFGWRISRWFNWEFGYKYQVEQRINDLEIRIEQLEQERN